MVIERIRMSAPPAGRQQLGKALAFLTGPTAVLPGCLSCSVFQTYQDSDELQVEMDWESKEDLIRYLKSDTYKQLFAFDGAESQATHYVYPDYKLGNSRENSGSRMAFSERQMEFGLSKFGSLPGRCRDCEYLFACNGECPRNRPIGTPEGEAGLSYLCGGLLKFWNHIDYEAKEIARCIACSEPYKRRRT